MDNQHYKNVKQGMNLVGQVRSGSNRKLIGGKIDRYGMMIDIVLTRTVKMQTIR